MRLTIWANSIAVSAGVSQPLLLSTSTHACISLIAWGERKTHQKAADACTDVQSYNLVLNSCTVHYNYCALYFVLYSARTRDLRVQSKLHSVCKQCTLYRYFSTGICVYRVRVQRDVPFSVSPPCRSEAQLTLGDERDELATEDSLWRVDH